MSAKCVTPVGLFYSIGRIFLWNKKSVPEFLPALTCLQYVLCNRQSILKRED
jgi:hypothetical protein